MGNSCRKAYKAIRKKRAEKTVVLLLIGLDNSGKSLVLKRIAGDRSDYVVPTVGFRTLSLRYKTIKVKIYDLGGGPQIRAIWQKYYAEVYGIIYVVDASDRSRLTENKTTFAELVSHDNVAGKPILLLANKQDLHYAIDELDLVENLEVETIVNNMRCPTRVETCSCIISESGSEALLSGIIDGYKWLVETIVKNYTYLNSRVKLAEKLQSNMRRKSSITSSRLSAFSTRQDLNNKQGSPSLTDANANASKLTKSKKFFLSARNKTAPVTQRLPIELIESSRFNSAMPRSLSQELQIVEKPDTDNPESRNSTFIQHRPQTAPHVIENNFFN